MEKGGLWWTLRTTYATGGRSPYRAKGTVLTLLGQQYPTGRVALYDQFTDVGLLVGRAWRVGRVEASGAAGLAVVTGQRIAYGGVRPWGGTFGVREQFMTVGVPVEAGISVRVATRRGRAVDVGTTLFGNLNGKAVFGGGVLGVTLTFL